MNEKKHDMHPGSKPMGLEACAGTGLPFTTAVFIAELGRSATPKLTAVSTWFF